MGVFETCGSHAIGLPSKLATTSLWNDWPLRLFARVGSAGASRAWPLSSITPSCGPETAKHRRRSCRADLGPTRSEAVGADILVVTTDNGTNLDFMNADGEITPQHYAFLVSK